MNQLPNVGQPVTSTDGRLSGSVDKLPDKGIEIPYVRVKWDSDPISYWYRWPGANESLLASEYHQPSLFE